MILMMLWKKSCCRFLLIVFFVVMVLVIWQVGPAIAMEVSCELINEYRYSYLDEGVVSSLREEMETDSKSIINLKVRGFIQDYHYRLELEGDGEEFEIDLEELTVSGLAGENVFEVGKKDWKWGKGFTYSPTYPLPDDRAYWGVEINMVTGNNYSVSLGGVLADEDNKEYGCWTRIGSLLGESDYEVVLSYLTSPVYAMDEAGSGLPVTPKEKGVVNLGFNYSRDLLNGLAVQAGLNGSYCQQDEEVRYQYQVGGKYITVSNHVLVCEAYCDRSDNDFLVFSFGNGDLFTDWEWQVRDFINLDNYGEVRTLQVRYVKNSNVIPSLEFNNYNGSFKMDSEWNVTLRIKVKI